MADVYFLLFSLLCGWTVCKVILDPKKAYEYPYFMGCMFAIFLLPQAISMTLNPGLVPADVVDATFLMCFLSLLMAILGYSYAPSLSIAHLLNRNLDQKRLVTIAIVYAIIGAIILTLINRSAAPEGGNWTGTLTILATLYQVISISFAVFVFLAIRTRKLTYILLAVATALPIVHMIIFAGRREATALFTLTIAFAFFDLKGITPPRVLIIGMLLFAMLIMPVIGTYRQLAREDPVTAITSIDLKNGFVKYYREGKDLELTVAANMIDATSFYNNYDFGADYWNEMIFRYFPAQVFGSDAKAALMIGGRGQDRFYRQYTPTNGLTTTCVGDAYRHLWYFGAFFYFFLGGFFRELRRSLATSNVLVKTFYIICMVQALLSITHGTVMFLPGIFHMFFFSWIAASYAKL